MKKGLEIETLFRLLQERGMQLQLDRYQSLVENIPQQLNCNSQNWNVILLQKPSHCCTVQFEVSYCVLELSRQSCVLGHGKQTVTMIIIMPVHFHYPSVHLLVGDIR